MSPISSNVSRHPDILMVNSSMRPSLVTQVTETATSAVQTVLAALRSSVSRLYDLAKTVGGAFAQVTPEALLNWFATVERNVSLLAARTRDKTQIWLHGAELQRVLQAFLNEEVTAAINDIMRNWPQALQAEFTQRHVCLTKNLVEVAGESLSNAHKLYNEALEQQAVAQARKPANMRPIPEIGLSPPPSVRVMAPPILSREQMSILTPGQRRELVEQHQACIQFPQSKDGRSDFPVKSGGPI